MQGFAKDFRIEKWIVVELIDKTPTLPKLSMENLGPVHTFSIHSTTLQFFDLEYSGHPNNFFCLFNPWIVIWGQVIEIDL